MQLIKPQERSLPSFMMEVKAEMEQKIFIAKGPGIYSCPLLSPGPRPHWFQVGSSDKRWVSQSPMRFNKETMIWMNEFQRIGEGL